MILLLQFRRNRWANMKHHQYNTHNFDLLIKILWSDCTEIKVIHPSTYLCYVKVLLSAIFSQKKNIRLLVGNNCRNPLFSPLIQFEYSNYFNGFGLLLSRFFRYTQNKWYRARANCASATFSILSNIHALKSWIIAMNENQQAQMQNPPTIMISTRWIKTFMHAYNQAKIRELVYSWISRIRLLL